MLKKNRDVIVQSLNVLLENPNIRPYLFRTRFERNMMRIMKYATDINDLNLYSVAKSSLSKLSYIVDKSNTTSTGMLRSYVILKDNIEELLKIV